MQVEIRCFLSLESEALALHCIGDMVAITAQAQIKHVSRYWRNYKGLLPQILSFHGIIYGSQMFRGDQGVGASLAALDNLPLAFYHDYGQLLNLAFHCSRSYLQCVEEQRTAGSIVSLGISLWGTANLIAPESGEETIPMQSMYLGKMISFKSRQGELIRISQSHWIDMLATIDYPQRRYIELPVLLPQEWNVEFRGAIEHLNQAHVLFANRKYREAVQRCRQSRDTLLGDDKVNWSTNFLEPKIGVEKAKMINESLKALNNLGHASSHGNGIEVDRDTAHYVISSLTLILNYIGQKSR